MDRDIIVKPKVCVIIPNKDGLSHLKYSLPLLMGTSYANYCCILVDNNSRDESISFVRNNYPVIQILENKLKKGFASTVNIGIKHALAQNAEYIAIFNSDIKVLPQWIDVAMDIFKTRKNVGLVGYTEILKENESLYYSDQKTEVSYRKVKRLSGCLYLCPSTVFRQIGFFDEKYFMYGEDNDFFSRLIQAGYVILETNIPVWHYGEGASQGRSFKMTWLAYRNAIRYSLKNDNFFGIVKMLLSLLNQGCNPFMLRKVSDASSRRIRRYNPVVNFLLILASCAWNLLNIVQTIQARHNCRQLIKKIKLN
ncbi:MAG: glycosyltransferase family 2 protein [Candidatus Omnitrophota bacterium]